MGDESELREVEQDAPRTPEELTETERIRIALALELIGLVLEIGVVLLVHHHLAPVLDHEIPVPDCQIAQE